VSGCLRLALVSSQAVAGADQAIRFGSGLIGPSFYIFFMWACSDTNLVPLLEDGPLVFGTYFISNTFWKFLALVTVHISK
jgi:hypothetical protein